MKAYEVNKYLENPDLKYGIFLLFGPNNGLIFENSQRLINYYTKISTEPLNIITLECAQILDDPAILALEARTLPMFGALVLIRVRSANKRITPIIKQLIADMPEAIIILEASNLKASDALPKLLNNNNFARLLPCYLDDERAIGDIIRQNFANENINIAPDAISTLKDILGNDREIMRRELEKLNLYAMETKIITNEDIFTLCGDNSNITIDKINDAAGTGRVEQLDKEVAKALNSGIDPQRLLISALMHFSWLRRLRTQYDKGKNPKNIF